MAHTMMRTACAALAGLALAGTVGCAGSGNGSDAAASHERPGGLHTLVVAPLARTGSDGRLSRVDLSSAAASSPATAMVYRVRPARVRAADVRSQARRLGVVGRTIETTAEVRVQGDGAVFTVDRITGSFDYTTEQFEQQDSAVTGLLTDSEYRQRAETFLETRGLMKESAEFRDVNRDNVVGVLRDGRWVEEPYMVEVRFAHKPLGGTPFDKGVGPKIVVQFGDDGAILGAMSVWRDVEPYASYPLLKPAEAARQVEAGDAQVYDVQGTDSGVVEELELSYMNDPINYRQQFVVPAFVFVGRSKGGGRFTAVTRAVPKRFLDVRPEVTQETQAPVSVGR